MVHSQPDEVTTRIKRYFQGEEIKFPTKKLEEIFKQWHGKRRSEGCNKWEAEFELAVQHPDKKNIDTWVVYMKHLT